MAARSIPTAGRLVSLVALAALSGCLSGPPPADHFYRLEVGDPPGPASNPVTGTLQIDRPRVDALLGQRPILYRDGNDGAEIHQYTYHRWSDPPSLLVQTELVEFLDKAQAAATVMAVSARVDPDFVISSRIRRFEQIRGGGAGVAGVVVELDATLIGDGKVIVQERYVERRSTEDDSAGAAANALGAATEAVFKRLLASLDGR